MYTIKITNEETGEVICNREKVQAMIISDSTEEDTNILAVLECNLKTACNCYHGVRQITTELEDKHPEFELLHRIKKQ